MPQGPSGVFAAFRAMLYAPKTTFLMEAHNGVSARIVEESGFPGIWASGLTISTALGVRDRNEASWTQVLEVLEFMTHASSLPILLDGDTGYGDFNNFRLLVRKLCQRGVAAVCIEDKIFPKTNSFLGEGQPLADIDEFCGKIQAGKDAQPEEDFSIVARVEALIAGRGMNEALRRAEAYFRAGADAILIHSRQTTAQEVLEFAREWDNRCPLVIVPTRYYQTPTETFREHRISMVIWANHMMRASIQAMRDLATHVYNEESVADVEDHVTRLGDLFALADQQEIEDAERRYLPARGVPDRVIILAASRGGEDLEPLTLDRPKCMLEVHGQPILTRQIELFRAMHLLDVSVVAGWHAETLPTSGINRLLAPEHATTGNLHSLAQARDVLDGPCIVSYGDVVWRSYVLESLLQQTADVVLVIDTLPSLSPQHIQPGADLVECSQPFARDYLDETPIHLVEIGEKQVIRSIHGEWIGLARFSGRGARMARTHLDEMVLHPHHRQASLPALFNRMVNSGALIRIVYIAGHWIDINRAIDLERANRQDL